MPSKRPSLISLRQGPLTGREINIQWEDGELYLAIVVSYIPETDMHNIVYRRDGSLEKIGLSDTPNWTVNPPRKPTPGKPVLEGAIVEFFLPTDKKTYFGMVFKHSKEKEKLKLKVAFLDQTATINLRSTSFKFITSSPCLEKGFPISVDEEDWYLIVESYIEDQITETVKKEHTDRQEKVEITTSTRAGSVRATPHSLVAKDSGFPHKVHLKSISKRRVAKPRSAGKDSVTNSHGAVKGDLPDVE